MSRRTPDGEDDARRDEHRLKKPRWTAVRPRIFRDDGEDGEDDAHRPKKPRWTAVRPRIFRDDGEDGEDDAQSDELRPKKLRWTAVRPRIFQDDGEDGEDDAQSDELLILENASEEEESEGGGKRGGGEERELGEQHQRKAGGKGVVQRSEGMSPAGKRAEPEVKTGGAGSKEAHGRTKKRFCHPFTQSDWSMCAHTSKTRGTIRGWPSPSRQELPTPPGKPSTINPKPWLRIPQP